MVICCFHPFIVLISYCFSFLNTIGLKRTVILIKQYKKRAGRPFLSSTKTIYNLQANDESYELRSTYLSVGNQVVA